MIAPQAELEGLPGLWEAGLGAAYDHYLAVARDALTGGVAEVAALAAALVEVALHLQRLGQPAPPPADLLRADLCLARASRLLADTRRQRLQVAFARAIEEHAAAATGTSRAGELRTSLAAAIRAGAPA